ncbi:MAG: hypothetical protein P0S95_04420 [Rhabdochlamydiaceae bacterium]|nr:hypothetical protein [Candidatus Amphrikana amoebophyrae]
MALKYTGDDLGLTRDELIKLRVGKVEFCVKGYAIDTFIIQKTGPTVRIVYELPVLNYSRLKARDSCFIAPLLGQLHKLYNRSPYGL